MTTWPFADPPNVAVFTSRHVLDGRDWIHHVAHDEEDGAWQFHGNGGPTAEEDAAVVSLRTMLARDPSICALADLPLGWHAWRENERDPWQRRRKA